MNTYNEMESAVDRILRDLDRFLGSDRFDPPVYEAIKGTVEAVTGMRCVLDDDTVAALLGSGGKIHVLRERLPYGI